LVYDNIRGEISRVDGMTGNVRGVEPVSEGKRERGGCFRASARMFYKADINPQAEVQFSHVTQ
jgi:hypothetical protein